MIAGISFCCQLAHTHYASSCSVTYLHHSCQFCQSALSLPPSPSTSTQSNCCCVLVRAWGRGCVSETHPGDVARPASGGAEECGGLAGAPQCEAAGAAYAPGHPHLAQIRLPLPQGRPRQVRDRGILSVRMSNQESLRLNLYHLAFAHIDVSLTIVATRSLLRF